VTRRVKAERAAALARDASQNRHTTVRQLTEDDIRALITGLGDLRDIIGDAEAPVKAAIYEQLGLQVTYLPEQDKLRADVTISPEIFAGQTDKYGVMGRVRGGLDQPYEDKSGRPDYKSGRPRARSTGCRWPAMPYMSVDLLEPGGL
jgi:hypothetical protein